MDTISCLMVTEGRFPLARRAMDCYFAQGYPDKELVIVTCGSKEYKDNLTEYASACGRADVLVIHVPSRVPLGEMRNIAIESASGPFVCQWDDDDLSHPQRLALQVNFLIKTQCEASVIGENLHLFTDTGLIYWCNWAGSSRHIGHPATLLARKAALPRYNKCLNRREDSAMQHQLIASGAGVSVIRGHAELFLYTWHGTNVFQRMHHISLIRAYGLTLEALGDKASRICAALDIYSPMSEITVADKNDTPLLVWKSSFDRPKPIVKIEPDGHHDNHR